MISIATAFVPPDHVDAIGDPPPDDRVHLQPVLGDHHTLRGTAASLVGDHHRDRELWATGSRLVPLSNTAWLLARP